MTPSNRTVVLVAGLAALAGAVASLLFQPFVLYRLAGTDTGQAVLQATLAARAPAVPAGVSMAQHGQRLPAMTATDLSGATVRLPDAWAGRVTLVNLWATWCGPCLKEMPHLQEYASQQGKNGVQVVGIALDEPAAVRSFLSQHGIDYPVLLDVPGPADAGVRMGNTSGVLPFSALIAADGRLLKTRVGPFEDVAAIERWTAP